MLRVGWNSEHVSHKSDHSSLVNPDTSRRIQLYTFPKQLARTLMLSHHPHLNYSLNFKQEAARSNFLINAPGCHNEPAHTFTPSAGSNQSPSLLSTWKLSITIWQCMQMVGRKIVCKYDSAYCWERLMLKNVAVQNECMNNEVEEDKKKTFEMNCTRSGRKGFKKCSCELFNNGRFTGGTCKWICTTSPCMAKHPPPPSSRCWSVEHVCAHCLVSLRS